MKSASFKKPPIIEQMLKTDVKPEAVPTKMDPALVVKPNNGRGMGKLAKRAKKKAY